MSDIKQLLLFYLLVFIDMTEKKNNHLFTVIILMLNISKYVEMM